MTTFPEVDIQGIAAGGAGVGELPGGKVVFVPRTAPGDRVQVRVLVEKNRWARGEALEWITLGPDRREPPCACYRECDGCALQHLAYETQIRWKGRWVGDALRRLGGMETADPEVEPSPKELRYRNKITFTLRRLGGGRLVAGFRQLGRKGRIVDVGAECLLPEEPLTAAWRELREGWGPEADLLPEGRELRLTLRGGTEGAGLLIRGGTGRGNPKGLLASVPGLSSVWRERKGRSPEHLEGDRAVSVPWGDGHVDLEGGGFLQVNQRVGEAVYAHIREDLGPVGEKSIIDAYCGSGVLARALAGDGAAVVGIDLDPGDAQNTGRGAIDRFRRVVGRVEEELEGFLPADVVLLNPPRAGLDPAVPPILARYPPDTMVYVSCDPATLARDLARLGRGFVTVNLKSFDLFPQTGHVETVATLRWRDG